MQWQHDLLQRRYTAPAPGQAPAGGSNGEQLAMQPIWPVSIKAVPLQALGGSFAVASTLLPAGPGGERGTMLNSHTMGVVKATKHPDEAWAWVKWSSGRTTRCSGCSPATGARRAAGRVARRAGAARDPGVEGLGRPDGPGPPNHVPANLRGQELEAAFDQHTGAIWRGELGPADGIKQTAPAVQEVLRLPRA